MQSLCIKNEYHGLPEFGSQVKPKHGFYSHINLNLNCILYSDSACTLG